LLDDDFLKENVDGEALQWAHRRAQMLAPSTWICLVISDGAPVDDAALMHNESGILYDHLQRVIADIEAMPNVRLGAIGLRYDVAPLYRCAASIEVFPMDPEIPAKLFKRLMFGEQDVGDGKLSI
jgi:cobaltochelatase CobT